MIWTVVRVGLLRMWHGRTEILLTFVVPIAFFTIFAFIFDEQVGLGKSPKVSLALVDEDGTHEGAGSLVLTVNNVAPTVIVSGPTDAVRGETISITIDATDPKSGTAEFKATAINVRPKEAVRA